mmetsp:Transcript_22641/g.62522  ORF Transcript_22641/g.62522 Transcript_22641/m.62522 type:complete len:255 (-) Transcript_22641:64-828(-)
MGGQHDWQQVPAALHLEASAICIRKANGVALYSPLTPCLLPGVHLGSSTPAQQFTLLLKEQRQVKLGWTAHGVAPERLHGAIHCCQTTLGVDLLLQSCQPVRCQAVLVFVLAVGALQLRIPRFQLSHLCSEPSNSCVAPFHAVRQLQLRKQLLPCAFNALLLALRHLLVRLMVLLVLLHSREEGVAAERILLMSFLPLRTGLAAMPPASLSLIHIPQCTSLHVAPPGTKVPPGPRAGEHWSLLLLSLQALSSMN